MDRSMARSTLYNTFSLCFTYPDENVCSWILEGAWLEEMKESLKLLGEESFESYLSPLEEILRGEKERLSLELKREYTRLFINAFPHVVAPPYGSIYLEKEGQVFGKTTSEVLQFYHQISLDIKEEIKDLPDHIAHELEFMGILAKQESQATGSEKIRLEETQMDFFSRFLLPWVPIFCQKIETNSYSPFYRHLGQLTREFIHLEKNYLGVSEEINYQKRIEPEIRGG